MEAIKENIKINSENTVIPKAAAWSFVGILAISCITLFFNFGIRITTIEKDVEKISEKVESNNTFINSNKEKIEENNKMFAEILRRLDSWESKLFLKQDKKFVE
jgi:hypothetical protein